ncbi:MAG: hypothetical protein COT28_19385 [Methylobacterium sp. CG08_land_8_20_14_0_20_71_15]|nr:MAG: hypothetical protein COT56_06250 [Methylobacterium sp. CG09_land_8_20_14_0_10_71_15]PIU11450.1 MAG: hypothetical protein COT28_19385 [Methylobacterium sp. CG08_land_8_20_14_0_20_71_15]
MAGRTARAPDGAVGHVRDAKRYAVDAMSSLTTGIKRIVLFACMISAFPSSRAGPSTSQPKCRHCLVTMRAA